MMRAADFEYTRVDSVAAASAALRDDPGAVLVAGGQSLVPMLKLRLVRPTRVVDISGLEGLDELAVSDDQLTIGAAATVAQILASEEVRRSSPMLHEAAAVIADPLVRNLGTIGGNIAHADPLNDLPPALMAARGRIVTAGPEGARTIEADEVFQGPFTTTLAGGEVIVGLEIPRSPYGSYEKFKRAAVDYGVVAVAVQLDVVEGEIRGAGIAVAGAQEVAPRASAAEDTLVGADPKTLDLGRVAEAVGGGEFTMIDDERGTGRYKRALVRVLAHRALERAATGAERQPR